MSDSLLILATASDDLPARTRPSVTRSTLYTQLHPPLPRHEPRTYLSVASPRFSTTDRASSSAVQRPASSLPWQLELQAPSRDWLW